MYTGAELFNQEEVFGKDREGKVRSIRVFCAGEHDGHPDSQQS